MSLGLSPIWMMEEQDLSTRLTVVENVLATATFQDVIKFGQTVAQFKASEEVVAESDYAPRPPYRVVGETAIFEVSGAMTKRDNCMMALYGGFSTRALENGLDMAAKDPSVRKAVIKMETPGGNVDGVAEAAMAFKRFKESGKALTVWGDGLIASAGVWLATHADEIYMSSDNAGYGSIGVLTSVVDKSAQLEGMGMKVYKVDTGAYKAIGAYFSPVTQEQLASVQERVDAVGADFAQVVSETRGIPVKMGKGVADGRVFRAQEAVKAGLIDGVAPFQSVLDKMNGSYQFARTPRQRGAMSTGMSASASPTTITAEAEGETTNMHVDDIKAAEEQEVSRFRALAEKFGLVKPAAKPAAQAETTEKSEQAETNEALLAEANASLETATATIADLTAKLTASTGTITALLSAGGFGADGDTATLEALVKDGITARFDAADNLATQMNRALGVGTTSAAAIQEKMQGKTLSDFKAEIAPFLAAGDSHFNPDPAGTSKAGEAGRATLDESASEVVKTDAELKAESEGATTRTREIRRGLRSLVGD